jgi:hypothetical protein
VPTEVQPCGPPPAGAWLGFWNAGRDDGRGVEATCPAGWADGGRREDPVSGGGWRRSAPAPVGVAVAARALLLLGSAARLATAA